MTNGPKGTSAATKNFAAHFNGLVLTIIACKSAAQYRTNSPPWIAPTIETASGLPATYFKGIAIKKSNKVDVPSHKPTVRKRCKTLRFKAHSVP